MSTRKKKAAAPAEPEQPAAAPQAAKDESTAAGKAKPAPIRRGQGLRLSTSAAADDAAAAETPAPAPSALPPAIAAPPQDQPKPQDRTVKVKQVAVPPMRMPFEQKLIRYRQAGSGPPLLLIHGWGESAQTWQNTLEVLADTRTVYTPDLPGPASAPPRDPWASVVQLAALVLAFADALELHQFDLNGHSFGAGVAAYLAARWPERVRRLVLTGFGVARTTPNQALFTLTRQSKERGSSLIQPWFDLWQPWFDFWQAWATALVSAQKESAKSATGIEPRDLAEALKGLTMPVLLVSGRDDPLISMSDLAATVDVAPGSRLVVLEQCGRLPMTENPTAYNREVRAFLLEESAG
jgi:pimeloyl-ACP methyl ester carboxylesterase